MKTLSMKIFVLAITTLIAAAAGCAGSPHRAARTALDGGDLSGAVAAAGQDQRALELISQEVLASALDDPSTRAASVRALVAAPRLPSQTLAAAVAAPSASTRAAAWAVLAARGEPEATAELVELAGDAGHSEARALALTALPVEVSEGPLLCGAALTDGDPRVRRAAAACAVDMERLVDLAREEEDPRVAAAALRRLARLSLGEGGLALATGRLEEGNRALALRVAALELLASLDRTAEGVEAALRRVAAGEDEVALRAAVALQDVGVIAAALSSESGAMVAPAAVAAAQLGAPELEGPLSAALARCSEDPEGRLQLSAALYSLSRGREGGGALEALLPEAGWIGLLAAAVVLDTAAAQERLLEAVGSGESAERAYAVSFAPRLEVDRGLELASSVLADDDVRVRVAAAAAVLRIVP